MVDLTFLEGFTRGDETKIKRYVSMYLKVAPEILDRMRENIENKNWADLAINAHSLKPQAEYMGIPALKEVLMDIENSVKNMETTNLDSQFDTANKLHQKAAIFLKDYID